MSHVHLSYSNIIKEHLAVWRQPKPSSTPLFCDLPKTYKSYLPLPQPKPPFTLLFYGLSKILRCNIKSIWLDNKSHHYRDISNKIKTIYIQHVCAFNIFLRFGIRKLAVSKRIFQKKLWSFSGFYHLHLEKLLSYSLLYHLNQETWKLSITLQNGWSFKLIFPYCKKSFCFC